jgi:hypothetical protein
VQKALDTGIELQSVFRSDEAMTLIREDQVISLFSVLSNRCNNLITFCLLHMRIIGTMSNNQVFSCALEIIR